MHEGKWANESTLCFVKHIAELPPRFLTGPSGEEVEKSWFAGGAARNQVSKTLIQNFVSVWKLQPLTVVSCNIPRNEGRYAFFCVHVVQVVDSFFKTAAQLRACCRQAQRRSWTAPMQTMRGFHSTWRRNFTSGLNEKLLPQMEDFLLQDANSVPSVCLVNRYCLLLCIGNPDGIMGKNLFGRGMPLEEW